MIVLQRPNLVTVRWISRGGGCDQRRCVSRSRAGL